MSELRSSWEIAVERSENPANWDPNVIPPMTHPLSKHWRQPDMAKVRIDDEFAYMDERAFWSLSDYSCSQPTGCYPGKAWRSNSHQFNKSHPNVWWLCWFGYSEDPNMCRTYCRRIQFYDSLDYQI